MTPNPIRELEPKSKSIWVVYGAGLNSELITSILFFTIVTFFWAEVVEKSSTKKPDLNLLRPFTSLTNKFEVSDSSSDKDV